MSSSTVAKTKQGYGYKYTDLAQIHSYLESIGMRYYQYIEPCGEFDYIYTVPIKINADGSETPLEPRRGCRIINAPLSGKANPAQENGSAITYARRYSLLMAFGLATDDDDAESQTRKSDNKQTSNKQTIKKDTPEEAAKNQQMVDSVDQSQVPNGSGMTAERIAKLQAEMKRTGVALATILGTAKVKDIKDMPEETYLAIMHKLEKTKDKA